ncbi:GxxExxY protein [Candidatus Shapirobacteria bacterium]|nr:GxxExxY protein [Candidatus Shapirobacteria bacterium]
MAKLIEPELSYQIVGMLFKIHNKLGPTYQEKYYQRAVEQELKESKIPHKRESKVEIGYDNKRLGNYSVDFIIDNKIALEIKSVNYLHPKYINQVLGYLNAFQIRLGIIANFKKKKLEYKRIILPDTYLRESY